MKAVSVVIPTSNRLPLLRRAIASVENQDYPGPIEIVVVPADSNPIAFRELENIVRKTKVRCRISALRLDEQIVADNPLLKIYVWARVARQRNLGVATSEGEYIAHLDEDNEYLPSHLSSLAEVLEQKPELPAAHSWRRLLWEDGSPYTGDLYPWLKQATPIHARHIFLELVRYGVFQQASSEVRDQYMTPSGEQLLTIDSSEWLLRRAFHLQFAFRERMTFREVSHMLTEDYLFCKSLADAGVRVGCSEKFTLNYYLGGYTSRWLKEYLQ